ncbi:hypothetical protein PSU4_33260 [Pseudonocardia sulfidoxydans NBRC 16205]|uniref:DUF305 domain-containing protein n=1 Tax=Pseudonocardia sulfidoxydans NBRC 16205 TaxID=1223511 RepID=A0A511DHU7_9PSEU|nr:DUF305 domain-containing protein [Pseudonocardia sulfidoxydans]GEL24372.1 hypothetical protein PSU4_33260 [Pseudonocardia sulfidoxydans NBRC 16205]
MTSADVARRDQPAGAEEPPGPPPADSHDGDDGGGGREPRWVRPVLVVGAVLALLLLGGAGGLLLGLHNATGDLVAPASDSVDVGFAQDMSTHHQQAVEMATWERDHTTSPELRQLAYDIESTQEAQIGRMQGWLALWGAPAQHSGGYMQWMVGAPAHSHGPTVANSGLAAMPGMATADELRRLRASTGTEMDVLFLQLMLRHHQGGVGMLEYGARYAQIPEVRNLAAQMLSSQTSESQYMTQLLAERGAQPLPLQ